MAGLIEATNEINLVVKAAWDANAAAIAGAETRLTFSLRDGDATPQTADKKDFGGTWARVTIRHTSSSGRSLSRIRYQHDGTLFVNIFVPALKTTTGRKTLELADMVADALKAHKGLVDFRSVRPQEAGRDGAWTQCNVIADFTHDEYRG